MPLFAYVCVYVGALFSVPVSVCLRLRTVVCARMCECVSMRARACVFSACVSVGKGVKVLPGRSVNQSEVCCRGILSDLLFPLILL